VIDWLGAHGRTSKETSQVLGAVSVLDTVDEAFVVIRLHAGFDAVEREGGKRGEDARRTGRYLGAIAPDQSLGSLPLSLSCLRHDGCGRRAAWDILLVTNLCDLSSHASAGRVREQEKESLFVFFS
jgi:hypothetical protein